MLINNFKTLQRTITLKKKINFTNLILKFKERFPLTRK